MRRHAARGHGIKPAGKPGIFIGKQKSDVLLAGKTPSPCKNACLAWGSSSKAQCRCNKSASRNRPVPASKPGKKNIRFKPSGRREGKPWQPLTQSSALRYSRLIHTAGFPAACSLAGSAFGQFAGECFDHHIGNVDGLPQLRPLTLRPPAAIGVPRRHRPQGTAAQTPANHRPTDARPADARPPTGGPNARSHQCR